MRFSSALFASLAAQVVFAGGPSIPSKTGIIAVDVGLSVVGDVQSAVEAEGELVVNFVKEDLFPLAKTSLFIIAQQVQSINKALTPYALYVFQPLGEAELGNVLTLLTRTHALITDIKYLVTKLLSDFSEQAQKAIAVELKYLLGNVKPIVKPITTLCKSLAGTSTSETSKQIDIALDDLSYAAGASLDPLRVAVDKLV